MKKYDPVKTWNKLLSMEKYDWKSPLSNLVESIAILKEKNVKKILDFGFGLGRHLIYLKKQGFDVVGCDISDVAISRAKKRLEQEGISDIRLEKTEEISTPFENEEFDAILCVGALHHTTLPTIKKIIKGFERLLKPKGILLNRVLSINVPNHEFGKKLEENTFYQKEYGADVNVIHHYFSKEELRQLFSNFNIIALKEVMLEEIPEYKTGEWWLIAEKK